MRRLVDNPQYFAVSANIVNGAALQWIHFSMGVYEPYYPVSSWISIVFITVVCNSRLIKLSRT